MQSSPKVIIVTPSFNQGRYLEETIQSVLNQSYENIDLYVVDGGSSDDSVEIIKRYRSDLAGWVSEPDAGQASAVNRGWRDAARGDIYSFLNSDDMLEPLAVEAVVDVFQQDASLGLVYGQGTWTDEFDHPVGRTNVHVDSQGFVDSLPGLPQPAAFVRDFVLEDVGLLDESFHFALDGEFFSRVMGTYPSRALDIQLARMRLHGSSKSVGSGFGFSSEVLKIATRIVAHPDRFPRFEVEPHKVLATGLRVGAQFEAYNGRSGRGMLHWLASVMLNPAMLFVVVGRDIPKWGLRMLIGPVNFRRLARLRHGSGRDIA